MFSCTCSSDAVACSTAAWSRSRLVQPISRSAFSAVATASGLTSYADTQVTSSWTGSAAISTGLVVISAATPATAIARSATAVGFLGREHHPGGEPPRPAVDDPHREPEVLGVGRSLEHSVAYPEVLVAHALEAEVGVAGSQLARPGQRDVAEVAEGERQEGRVELGSGHVTTLAGRGAAEPGVGREVELVPRPSPRGRDGRVETQSS